MYNALAYNKNQLNIQLYVLQIYFMPFLLYLTIHLKFLILNDYKSAAFHIAVWDQLALHRQLKDCAKLWSITGPATSLLVPNAAIWEHGSSVALSFHLLPLSEIFLKHLYFDVKLKMPCKNRMHLWHHFSAKMTSCHSFEM